MIQVKKLLFLVAILLVSSCYLPFKTHAACASSTSLDHYNCNLQGGSTNFLSTCAWEYGGYRDTYACNTSTCQTVNNACSSNDSAASCYRTSITFNGVTTYTCVTNVSLCSHGGCYVADPPPTPVPTVAPPPGCVAGSCDTSNCSNVCQGSGCGWNGCGTCSGGTKNCTSTPPPVSANVDGYHDADSGIQDFGLCRAAGWATDPDDTSRKVTVRILVDGNSTPVYTGLADSFRPDLLSAGVCSGSGGNCAFNFYLNGLVSYNAYHTIQTQAQDINTGTWKDLNLTPRTLYCEGGVIQGYKVIDPGSQAIPPANGQTVTMDGGSPQTSNPYGYGFFDISSGTHQISVTEPPGGYITSAQICYNNNLFCGTIASTCSAGVCSAMVSNANIKSTFNPSVDPFPHADLWWHFLMPTCSITSIAGGPFVRDSFTTNTTINVPTSTTGGGIMQSVTLALTSGSGNSITTSNPDSSSPFSFNIATLPTATGPVSVQATGRLTTGQTCTNTVSIPVTDAVNSWWQLQGGGNAMAPSGNIRSLPLFGSATDFVCSPGTGTCGIGVGGTISVLPGKWAPPTSTTWIVNGSTNAGIFDSTILTSNTYSYTTMLTQAKALFDVGTASASTVNLNALIASQAASTDGVKYVELTSSNNPITITTPSNIGVGKLVVFAPGNVYITADLINHVGSTYGVFVLLANGNITVDPAVATLDGVYYAQGNFTTGTGTTQLTVNGTVVGMGGIGLQRGPASTTAPIEIFNFIPHYIVNFPQGLNRKHTTQRLGEP